MEILESVAAVPVTLVQSYPDYKFKYKPLDLETLFVNKGLYQTRVCVEFGFEI